MDDKPQLSQSSTQSAKTADPGAEKHDTKLSHHPDSSKVRALALALLVILSSGFGFLGGWLAQDAAPISSTRDDRLVLENQGELISEIVNKVGKSVVSITVEREGAAGFFGFDDTPVGGTGIILSDNGLIVTNRHVLPDNATNVSVTLSDGTEYDNVEIVGRTLERDSLDIAFLQINDTRDEKLAAASIGNSSEMNVGDSVVAIGNALGQFENTVTSGIISGYGRSVQVSGGGSSEVQTLENVFQTDAAINEGNSGGPLVNLEGEVVGINTAAALGGTAQNIGFAIPIDDVKGLIESVVETGTLQRPYLGVYYITLTDDVAEFYELKVNRGAYIPPSQGGEPSLLDDGPAKDAGLREGDIITKIGDVAIDQDRSLASAVNKYPVGEKVTLTVLRDGKELKIEVTLAAAPIE